MLDVREHVFFLVILYSEIFFTSILWHLKVISQINLSSLNKIFKERNDTVQ